MSRAARTFAWRALAPAALLAVLTAALDAGAHGSRLVPLEDRPVRGQPAARGTPGRRLLVAPHAFGWTGAHLGGHVAFGISSAQGTLGASDATRWSSASRSLSGGVQLGYDHVLPSRFLVGVEGDITFPYFAEDGVIVSRAAPQGSVTEKLDFVSTLCGRIGYALDSWLLYGTGGLAWSQARFGETSAATGATSAALSWRGGWTAGAGAEVVIAPAWTVRAEYLLEHLEGSSAALPAGPRFESSATTIHDVRLALNWHFGFPGEPPATPGLAGDGWWLDPASWNAHWQATLVEQGYLGFRSPYEGANSLSGSTQFRNTLSATAFLGLRLWEGGQLYVNPEVDQGYGLSETLGVAAFPNGEAQKASYPVPRLNIDRVIVRQTFGLGGERALVQDAPNQLPGVRDVSRITLTAGRLSVGDAFGLNAYADDPRTQFLNWNIYGSGSYDWTMDRPGFTWGALVELNQARWALRAGYFLEPTESNGNSFDTDVPTHGQYLVEPEVRYAAFSQPGILRLMAWATRANMGSYSEAVAMPVTASGYPDIAQTRQVRGTYGFVANVEQALSRDVGVFSRASWTPGLVEVMGWTDCDESLSVGTLVTGAVWRRPGDRLGVAGVVEGLSKEARAYFAAGGLGIVIGDGRLDYRPEQVLEVFYAMGLASWATLTADVQLLANPGYNADRGPVPIYALRLHAER